jgi:hypothetical protein
MRQLSDENPTFAATAYIARPRAKLTRGVPARAKPGARYSRGFFHRWPAFARGLLKIFEETLATHVAGSEARGLAFDHRPIRPMVGTNR